MKLVATNVFRSKALLGSKIALVAALAIFWMAPAAAAEYPEKPITLVVPFPPGGGADSIARTAMSKVGPALGQTIVIDNKPGQAGT